MNISQLGVIATVSAKLRLSSLCFHIEVLALHPQGAVGLALPSGGVEQRDDELEEDPWDSGSVGAVTLVVAAIGQLPSRRVPRGPSDLVLTDWRGS